MAEKIEKVHLDISCFKPGAAEPVTHKIDSPWVIICYDKSGMSLIFMSGLSVPRTAGILEERLLHNQNKANGDVSVTPFEKFKVDISATMKGEDKPKSETIEGESGLIVYEEDGLRQNYYAGMDIETAIGTMRIIQTQLVVGTTMKQMMTGMAVPRPGGLPPMGMPIINPRRTR